MRKFSIILMLGFMFAESFFALFQRNIIASEAQKLSIDESKTVEVIIRLEGKTVKGNPKVVE